VTAASVSPLDLRARLLIDGVWTDGAGTFDVTDKYTGEVIGRADRASHAQVQAAVAAADRSFQSTRLDATERFAILRRVCDGLEKRRDEIVRVLTAETGFPVSDTGNEVTRAIQTFLISAEEAKRLVGEVVPIEAAPGNAHRLGFTIRVPRGVVCGITSFNAPLNFVAHKAAPALAAGNTVVLKAPQATPFSAAILCEILLEAGLPPAHVNLVQGAR
jgi:acyl-CoA reductase-like NAD-dependent aldehyde dehydrogenase